jgi:hypothetical protein
MSPTAPQSYANHVRLVPLYHGVTFVLLLFNLGFAVKGLLAGYSHQRLMALGLAVALLLLLFFVRLFALGVQDPELMPRFGAFTPQQLVALRFAGDGELKDLAQQVLDGRLVKADDIKRSIRDWQADTLRV